MPQLTGSIQEVQLDLGFAIRAPGLVGRVDISTPLPPDPARRSRSVEDGTPEFDQALVETGMTEVKRIELQVSRDPFTPPPNALRSLDAGDTVELQAPDLGPEQGMVVLACDESGALTWHFPVKDAPADGSGASRGGGNDLRFSIPVAPTSPAPGTLGGQRSLIGIVGRKLLKVLVYPVSDVIVGAASSFLASQWEASRRPYRLRTFTPENRRQAGAEAHALREADWDRMRGGPSLLFIHGTFSTSHAAFDLMPDAVFARLHERYGGRVFAFDHFTLSADPLENVAWFLRQMPPGKKPRLDIICHSRGGLVSRMLAEQPCAFDLDNSGVEVRRVVFVAVPNQGTLLAHPDHMVQMVDRLTTLLNLFPTGPVTETFEALLTVIKVIGHGALKGLDGLAAMCPDGAFLNAFNGTPAATPAPARTYYAVAADYEPTHQGLRALTHGLADQVLDRVFERRPNDLVVPESGVYDPIPGNSGFPIATERLLRVPARAGVVHTTLFGHAEVGEQILKWLD